MEVNHAIRVIEMNDWYVYALFRPDTGDVFYIGTSTRSKRAREHLYAKGSSRRAKLIRAFSQFGYVDVPMVVIRMGLAVEDAAVTETALIDALGRQPNGPLVNTNRFSGLLTDEARTLMSQQARARERDPEAEMRRRKRMSDSDVREKMRAAKLGKPSAKRGKRYPSERVKEVQGRLGWITNGTSTETRVNKTLPVPDGWRRGRLPGRTFGY